MRPQSPDATPAAPAHRVVIDLDRVIGVLGRFALALVVAGTLVSVIRLTSDVVTDAADLGARFELHTDQSLPTWFSSVALFASVPLLAIMASAAPSTADRRRWAVLAALVLVFSMDEVATFHEYAAAVVDVQIFGFSGGYNWLAVGIPFAVAVVAAYTPFVLRLDPWLRARLVAVAATYFGGAVGVEALNAHTASTIGDDTYRYVLGTAVEESLELVGALLLLHTTMGHLHRWGAAVLVHFHAGSATG
ncbi:hypothetical protein [Actinomarinicola tropica]|uniref:Uncharacterized protein n=1 Tax=Actinomarinicola tropica TaxID=2789776 RepID=A0A5Q2RIW4_9ACTN|nr:hypothetical protein [Actinomarinicola tropica]QGG95464.1 hypothetical protein GH723_10340 [Actinomarinicola tropica]